MANTLYRLHYNENPLGPSPAVLDRIREHLAGLSLYPHRDDEALRNRLADFYGRGLSAGHVFSTYSGSEALDLVARAYLNPGDEVIVCGPTFHVYARTAAWQGANIVDVPLEEEHFGLRVHAVLREVTPRTRLVYLGNPNNPTGSIVTREEMARLHMGLPEGVTVVSDEVYHHFVSHPQYSDSLADVAAGRNVIVLHSFSKVYGMAGLRVGVAVSRPDIIERLGRYRRTFHLGSLEMEAAMAAIEDQAHVELSVALAERGKRRLYADFDRLKVRYWPSEGNFILFRTPVPADDLAAGMADHGILVGSGTRFGLKHSIRVSVGIPEANQAFVSALEAHPDGLPVVHEDRLLPDSDNRRRQKSPGSGPGHSTKENACHRPHCSNGRNGSWSGDRTGNSGFRLKPTWSFPTVRA